MNIPETPKFLFAPDKDAMELYIIHARYPLSLIWVRQTIPAQLFIVETEIEIEEGLDDEETQLEKQDQQAELLREAADFYRKNSIQKSN